MKNRLFNPLALPTALPRIFANRGTVVAALWICAIAAGLAHAAGPGDASSKKPNFLFVLTNRSPTPASMETRS